MELMNGHTTHPGAQWFPEAQLGLFVHWGLSSVHGNIDLSWGMYKDWVFGPESIHPDEYFDLAKDFNPQCFNPEGWAKAASEAGFKYMVFTTKHHEGFALWPSLFGDFNTRNYLNGRDFVAEYVAACRKYNLKVGLYFTQPDWKIMRDYMAFGGWYEDRQQDLPVPQHVQDYYRAVFRGQLTELLTRYGQIDLIWFDGPGMDYVTREEIYALQPHIVIGRGEHDTDFNTLECYIPSQKEEYYEENLKGRWWECCHQWNTGGWGYTKDENYRSAEKILEFYKDVTEHKGNLLINVGPNKDGELPEVAYERIAEFGELLRAYKSGSKE